MNKYLKWVLGFSVLVITIATYRLISPGSDIRISIHNRLETSAGESERTEVFESTWTSFTNYSNITFDSQRCEFSSRRFVLALSFWEQLTMATNNLFALTAFTKDWQSHAVLPFTRAAEFWGITTIMKLYASSGFPLVSHAGPTLPLSIIYNVTKLNKLLCEKYRLPHLVTYEDFIDNADRNVILLHFNFESYGIRFPTKKQFNGRHFIKDCLHLNRFDHAKQMLETINNECTKRNKPHFVYTRACCVDQKYITTPFEIAAQCGFYDNENVTVIPTVWRGYSKDPKRTFRQMIPKDYSIDRPNSNQDVFPVTDSVLSNASRFFEKFSRGNGVIAIHIRTAKLAMLNMKDRKKNPASKCFKNAWKLIDSLRERYPKFVSKYFIDYGNFGSHSFEVSLGMKVSKIPFKKKNIHPLHYNPDIYNGVHDQGFVALVEQVAISNSSVLVLVGGGSFQEQMLTRFKISVKALLAYKVCWTKSLTIEKVLF